MNSPNRREFIKKSAKGVGFAAVAPYVTSGFAKNKPSDRINVAVVGLRGQGQVHYNNYAKMKNVRIAALCDIDERLYPKAVANIEKTCGYKPRTEFDFRKLIEDKDIDAVSIATPDHWHALQTIWACQAGKDVYVEKPVSFTVQEGRKMVQAARKYGRVVQAGLNWRSNSTHRRAMKYLYDGDFGDVYRAKAVIYKGRASIGKVKNSPIPDGVHWDLFLGPAQYRPFNLNRFHYGWHFFWDTSTADMGNTGVHTLDVARWGLNKSVHPVKVNCGGGLFIWDSDQETPNVQTAIFEYEDGKILEVEVNNLYTNPIGGIRGTGMFFYTTEGYMASPNGYETFKGEFTPKSPDIDSDGVSHRASNVSFPERNYYPGPVIKDLTDKEQTVSNFQNFIDCIRSRKWQNLYCEILEGHKSTTLCHIANISYRIGRKLIFNPHSEKFINDDDANSYLTREYRHPYVLPDKV